MATTKQAVAGIRERDGELQTNTTWTAWIFGVDERSLRYWEDKGAPKVERGWWNPREINAWLGRNGSGTDGDPDKFDEARKLKADILYREERAQREKLLREAAEGLYFAKSEVEDAWARRVIEVKTVLLGLANKIAGEFSDPEVRATVERVVNDDVYEALEQYSRDGIYTPKKRR